MLSFVNGNTQQKLNNNRLRVLVHVNITRTMNQINKSIANPGDEYGLHLKCTRIDDHTVVVHQDYFVPDQNVTTATFVTNEGRPDDTYNAVIHRHPAGCLSFSGTDDETLNPNFLCSLLYTVEKGIFKANVNLDTSLDRHHISVETENILVYATQSQLDALLAAEL